MNSLGYISEKVILTQDKGLTIALGARGHQSKTALEYPEAMGRRFYAIYENNKAIVDDISLYENHQLMIDAQTYWESQSELEDHLYSTAYLHCEEMSKQNPNHDSGQ